MTDAPTADRFAEADRLVEEAQRRAAALVRAALGPGPAERERQLLAQAAQETDRDPTK